MERRVVITGMGVVSAAGGTVEQFWATLTAGRSCVRPITRFDASSYPSRIAAAVTATAGLDPDRAVRDNGGQSRIEAFAMAAARDAYADAGLDTARYAPERIGVAMASGMGTYDHDEVFPACAASANDGHVDWRAFAAAAVPGLAPRALDRRTPGSVASQVAARVGAHGPVCSVMTACAGGTQAIGDAARWIRLGRADAVLAGGSDSELYPMGLASFCLLGALSRRNNAPERASRPFDVDRDGFVIGEGAGVVVLEELEAARARGARIVAEVAGFGSAADAWRATDPHPDAAGAVLAMRRALAQAGIAPERVGYVNAHGTSTPANDRVEARAMRDVFGVAAARVPISSTKSMIGHATVAAGAIEAIATALTLDRQVMHPTINVERLDPDCDLDVVPGEARDARGLEYALSNSFAFGGQIACVLLRRHAR